MGKTNKYTKILWKNALVGGLREYGNMFWTVIFAFREKNDSGNSDPVMTFITFVLSRSLFCFPYPSIVWT